MTVFKDKFLDILQMATNNLKVRSFDSPSTFDYSSKFYSRFDEK